MSPVKNDPPRHSATRLSTNFKLGPRHSGKIRGGSPTFETSSLSGDVSGPGDCLRFQVVETSLGGGGWLGKERESLQQYQSEGDGRGESEGRSTRGCRGSRQLTQLASLPPVAAECSGQRGGGRRAGGQTARLPPAKKAGETVTLTQERARRHQPKKLGKLSPSPRSQPSRPPLPASSSKESKG